MDCVIAEGRGVVAVFPVVPPVERVLVLLLAATFPVARTGEVLAFFSVSDFTSSITSAGSGIAAVGGGDAVSTSTCSFTSSGADTGGAGSCTSLDVFGGGDLTILRIESPTTLFSNDLLSSATLNVVVVVVVAILGAFTVAAGKPSTAFPFPFPLPFVTFPKVLLLLLLSLYCCGGHSLRSLISIAAESPVKWLVTLVERDWEGEAVGDALAGPPPGPTVD